MRPSYRIDAADSAHLGLTPSSERTILFGSELLSVFAITVEVHAEVPIEEADGILGLDLLMESDGDIVYSIMRDELHNTTPASSASRKLPNAEVMTSGVVHDLAWSFNADDDTTSFIGFWIDSGAGRTIYGLKQSHAFVAILQEDTPASRPVNHFFN